MSAADLTPPFACPTSGVLLGAFVKALALDDPSVGGRSASRLGSEPSLARQAREYFRGAWVAVDKQGEICGWVVAAALHSGVLDGLALPADETGRSRRIEDLLTYLLQRWLMSWDSVFHQGATGWPHPPRELGGLVLGRQAVIDLSLRMASLLQLMGISSDHEFVPCAAEEVPGKALIERLQARAARPMSRMDLANSLGVEKSTVDDWIDKGVVPRPANVANLASLFATKTMSREKLLRSLRLEYGFMGIRARLAASVGEGWALHLCGACACFVGWTLDLHAESRLPPAELQKRHTMTLFLGAAAEFNFWVLNRWLKLLEEPMWVDDILAARQGAVAARTQECFELIGDWPRTCRQYDESPETRSLPEDERRNQQTAAMIIAMSPRGFAGAYDERNLAALSQDQQIDYLFHLARERMARERYDEAVRLWRKVLAHRPDDADVHCYHGVSLWKARPGPDHDAAIDALRRACELRPEWDYPAAEVARVYLDRDWVENALHHLQRLPAALVSRSHDLSYTTGQTLVRLKRYAEALPFLDRAVELDSTNGDAWDLAAECAFRTGDKVGGGRKAREAFRLGRASSYNRWVRKIGQ